MKNFFLALFAFAGLASAACPYYPYHDFVWASDYQQPQRPPDTLLDNCQQLNLSDPSLCDLIQNSNFSEYEKKRLLLDDFVKNTRQPPFTEAAVWNKALNFTKYAPDGVAVGNGVYLRNAWTKITGISPSHAKASDNKTYLNDSGNLSLAFNFSFVVPRESFGGDCRTDYEVCGYDYSLNAFKNGQQLARSGLTAFFQTSENASFSSVLSVQSQYLIHHYRLVRRCWGRICRWVCEFFQTEDRRDSIQVSDNKTAYYQRNNLSGMVFVDGFQNGLLDAWLKIDGSDFNRARFSAGDSWLELQESEYKLEYGLTPYNALFVVSNSTTRPLQVHDLSIFSREATSDGSELIHFLAPASNLNCTLELSSHFQKNLVPEACFFNESQQPLINLTIANASNSSFTALTVFYDNSTKSPFANKALSFRYGNQMRQIETDGQGIASTSFDYSHGTNLVYAEFKTDFQVKSARAFAVVPAPSPDLIGLIVFWAGLAFALWLGFLFVKRQLE